MAAVNFPNNPSVNGTTTFKDAIKAVKDKYPKPS